MSDNDDAHVEEEERESIREQQKCLFNERLKETLSSFKPEAFDRSQFLTREKYEEVVAALEVSANAAANAFKLKEVQKEYPRVYYWNKKYTLLRFPDGANILTFKDNPREALDATMVVSHQGRVFDDLLALHIAGGHCKARTFYDRSTTKHGQSIPRWVTNLFVKCCPTCVRRRPRKKMVVGHKPILTHGFGRRGQVDLIDFQSCPDGTFKFLLNYQDHGIKFHVSRALTSKRAIAIAQALLEIFALIGPPCILQSDNGREFSGAAQRNPGRLVGLTDDVSCPHSQLIFSAPRTCPPLLYN